MEPDETVTPTAEEAPAWPEGAVLVGHTNRDHGEDGPVVHAWRGDLEESAEGEELAVAVCGATLHHRVAQPFEPGHPRACSSCASEAAG